MTEPLRVHPFRSSAGQRDWKRRELICECGSLKTASIHNVPERDEDEAATESRKLGEGGDE